MRLAILLTAVLGMAAAGCGSTPAPSNKNGVPHHGDGKNDHSTLNPVDQALADAQGYCVVTDEPLGSMGAPLKVNAKGQSVFVCCEGCEKAVREKPEAMLAKRDALRAQVAKERTAKK